MGRHGGTDNRADYIYQVQSCKVQILALNDFITQKENFAT